MFWRVETPSKPTSRKRTSRTHRPPQSTWLPFPFRFATPPPKPAPKPPRRKKPSAFPPHLSHHFGLGAAVFTILVCVYLADFLHILQQSVPIPAHSPPASPIHSPAPVDATALRSFSPDARLGVTAASSVTARPFNQSDRSVRSHGDHLPSRVTGGGRAATLSARSEPSEQARRRDDARRVGEAVKFPQTGPVSAPVSAGGKRNAPGQAKAHSALPKVPMNRNMLHLQVPDRSGLLDLQAVKRYYRKLAQAYLQTFSHGIYRQMYFDILRRRTYALTPPGANKGVQSILFQVIDRRVYMMDPYEVPRNSKPFYRSRINQVIWLLSKLASEGRIRNTEFLMAIHDCVQTVNKPHTYRGAHFEESNPTFTIVSCNFSDNIPFPMWEGSKHRGGGFVDWDDSIVDYSLDNIPWDQKQDRAVFRGGNRPSMYFRNKSDANAHCHDVGRTRLQYLSKQEPDVLDVSIGGTCGGVHSKLKRLEPREHHKYKYILYAEGNCMWADRTRQQVFGPSTIIKQETPCGQFFEPLMKPFVHYLPTDFFFKDTVERVRWARKNDEKAREIVRNANEFGKNFLTLKGIEAYVEVLLDEYTNLLVEPEVKLETGAIEVTNMRV